MVNEVEVEVDWKIGRADNRAEDPAAFDTLTSQPLPLRQALDDVVDFPTPLTDVAVRDVPPRDLGADRLGLLRPVEIVILAGGAYLFLNKDKLFPNTTAAPPAAAPRMDPISRATRLYEGGNTEGAIELLKSLPAIDPSHADAQALIAQWEANDRRLPSTDFDRPTTDVADDLTIDELAHRFWRWAKGY